MQQDNTTNKNPVSTQDNGKLRKRRQKTKENDSRKGTKKIERHQTSDEIKRLVSKIICIQSYLKNRI